MNIEVIRTDGDLKREVWTFYLNVSYSGRCIYFDFYSFQTKETLKHKKWVRQTHWQRLDSRYNNIENPPLPADVENEVREKFAEQIKLLPIMK